MFSPNAPPISKVATPSISAEPEPLTLPSIVILPPYAHSSPEIGYITMDNEDSTTARCGPTLPLSRQAQSILRLPMAKSVRAAETAVNNWYHHEKLRSIKT